MNKSRYSKILYWVAIIALILNLFFTLIPTLSQFTSMILLIFLFSIFIMPLMDDSRKTIKIISSSAIIIYFTNLLLFQISLLESLMIFIGVGIFIIKTSFKNLYFVKKKARNDNKSENNIIFSKRSREGFSFKLLLDNLCSFILPFFNPFQLTQQILHVFGQMIIFIRNSGDFSQIEDHTQNTKFLLPFKGTWTVGKGGIKKEYSHSWEVLNQRYGYDFLITDSEGKTHKGKGDELRDYFSYGRDVIAPADGEIIKAKDGIRDFPKPETMRVDHICRDFRGNFLMIKHSEDEYSFIGHLIPGSIQVTEGEKVKQGQKLGECGNSGHSTEPHIHFHVQNHPNFYLGMGLPIMFSKIEVNGIKKEKIYIKEGQKIKNVEL